MNQTSGFPPEFDPAVDDPRSAPEAYDRWILEHAPDSMSGHAARLRRAKAELCQAAAEAYHWEQIKAWITRFDRWLARQWERRHGR